jgi:aspartyl-tRNA(Asn)/glutamyl-tRNA(Gln) amidotransferase subunit B
VERALAYEIERQTELHDANTPPVQSTRGWDENKGVTTEQRLKEGSADYRYFPEPDLPPVDLVEVRERMRTMLPELPEATRIRMMDEYGFSDSDARFLVSNEGWTDYAEHVMSELGTWLESTDEKTKKSGGELLEDKKKKLAKLAGGWLTSKLAGLLTEQNKSIKDLTLSAEDFAEFLNILLKGDINSANGQKLLALMVETSRDPSSLMEEHDLGQNMSEEGLKAEIERIVAANPKQADELRAGKENVLMWFVGCVMKATQGKANPEKAKEMVNRIVRGS